ncbi:MAG TPA: T9SS type A sorting domain-containing protein, partial [Chitinophagaceae bacterium]|nr:T9SS type A sorting domain-containing protein [Chitinophagaceae bacterium]
QPSLCSSTGSITVTSPTGTGYQYSIDNGANWQTATLFPNLAAGSSPNIIVQSPQGCISASASSCDASNCANQRTSSSVVNSDKTTKSQNTIQAPISLKTPINIDNISIKETSVKAYPNPFSDKVKFEVTSAIAGNGSLEIVNMMGQKIRTVYQGFISVGSQTFELSLPVNQISHLVYVLRIGNKKMTGKLLQINQ